MRNRRTLRPRGWLWGLLGAGLLAAMLLHGNVSAEICDGTDPLCCEGDGTTCPPECSIKQWLIGDPANPDDDTVTCQRCPPAPPPDQCPDDPNKTEPGLCGCGVVEDAANRDNDAAINCLDGCPDDPSRTTAPCPCLPADSCAAKGYVCGTFVDSRCPAITHDCGACTPPQTCDPATHRCGCIPTKTCASEGYQCGSFVDDCGVTQPCANQCQEDTNPCTAAVTCQSNQCVYPAGNSGAECRAGAGVCDEPETCDGLRTTCPADRFKPDTTICRSAVDQCDAVESCTGASAGCPGDRTRNGTDQTCIDGDPCTTGDYCDHGECYGPDRYTCTPTECQASSVCDGLGGCTVTNEPDGISCTADTSACTDDICSGGRCTHPLASPLPAGCCDDDTDCQESPDNTCTTNTCDRDTYTCNPPVVTTAVAGCCGGDADCEESPPNVCTTNTCDTATNHCNDPVPVAGCCRSDADCSEESPDNVCTDATCNPTTHVCFFANNSNACNDDNACTEGDRCSAGQCQPGLAKACSPVDGCPATCQDPAAGSCEKIDPNCPYPTSGYTCDTSTGVCNPDSRSRASVVDCEKNCPPPPPGGRCGDGACGAGETCANCPADCGCVSPDICFNGSCCDPACPDLSPACEQTAYGNDGCGRPICSETGPVCGYICDTDSGDCYKGSQPGDSSMECENNCGIGPPPIKTCPNPYCDDGENCSNCPSDCTCTPPATCQNGACRPPCTPRTCADAGAACGTIDDSCGKTLDCGPCPDGQVCTGNQCRTEYYPCVEGSGCQRTIYTTGYLSLQECQDNCILYGCNDAANVCEEGRGLLFYSTCEQTCNSCQDLIDGYQVTDPNCWKISCNDGGGGGGCSTSCGGEVRDWTCYNGESYVSGQDVGCQGDFGCGAGSCCADYTCKTSTDMNGKTITWCGRKDIGAPGGSGSYPDDTCNNECKLYACKPGEGCKEDENGSYSSLQACQDSCKLWDCNPPGTSPICRQSSTGSYDSQTDCVNECAFEKYTCNATGCVKDPNGGIKGLAACQDICRYNCTDTGCVHAPGTGSHSSMQACEAACTYECDWMTYTCGRQEGGSYPTIDACRDACKNYVCEISYTTTADGPSCEGTIVAIAADGTRTNVIGPVGLFRGTSRSGAVTSSYWYNWNMGDCGGFAWGCYTATYGAGEPLPGGDQGACCDDPALSCHTRM